MYIKGYVTVTSVALRLLQAHDINPVYIRKIPGYDSFEIPDHLTKFFTYKAGNISTCGEVDVDLFALVRQGLEVKLKEIL